ncbi:MAG: PPK2 family polyphosphate kinase [Kofleriaceae bacterium]
MSEPRLFEPVASRYLVPFDGSFSLADCVTDPADNPGKQANAKELEQCVEKLSKLQGKLYPDQRYAVLLVFQAMDAAGKDGTIRAVLTGVNPQGCRVESFKAPTVHELDHDFMWRITNRLPPRGHIGVFNRSHYEEVLTVRVNPGFLDSQRLPRRPESLEQLWTERFDAINAFERHWASSGTVVLKFFLNVSQREQHKRFLDRINDDDAQWKFNATDLVESSKWSHYMAAYEAALRATSKPWAPWYAIPADSKSFMRLAVADIVVNTLSQLPLQHPKLSDRDRAALANARKQLEAE